MMCQTRFKITKEMGREMYPPVLKSKDCWFLYSIGNPNHFKCVLRAFIVISSPILSLVSTGLLLLGKVESNPYFFIPWLFLTMKGLLLTQTDNLITILRDMATKTNYAFGFRMEDLKWLFFYLTVFLLDLLEAFSFYEIFDLFLVLWNHHPGFDVDSANLGAIKKEIADIMETFSKCSLGSLSKLSLGSFTDSDETNDNELEEIKNIVKFSPKEDKKLFHTSSPVACLSKGEPATKKSVKQYVKPKEHKSDLQKQKERLNCSTGNDETPTSDSSEAHNEKRKKKSLADAKSGHFKNSLKNKSESDVNQSKDLGVNPYESYACADHKDMLGKSACEVNVVSS